MSISSSEERNDLKRVDRCVKKPVETILTPVKAIRAHCLWCMCDSAYEVKLCPSTDCPLYPYREGHNPNRKMELTDEQRELRRETGKRVRAAQLEARNGQP